VMMKRLQAARKQMLSFHAQGLPYQSETESTLVDQ
jgi:hypothetical protein